MSPQDSLIVIPQANAISREQRQSGLRTSQINHRGIEYYDKSRYFLELLREIGAVELNTNNELVISSFFANQPKGMVSRILGYVAEGLVVRECNQSFSENRKWANYARMLRQNSNSVFQLLKSIFYKPFLENPDNYIAVGTGFTKTKSYHNHIYNPQSDRDICWIHSYNHAKELITVEGMKKNKTHVAGIQLKVSLGKKGDYVTNYFKKKPYYTLYPVVYFDLGDDFHQVKDNLLNLDSDTVKPNTLFARNVNYEAFSRKEIVDIMLIRGKSIAPELHEELLYYKKVLNKIISGKIKLVDLNNTEVLISLILEYSGYNLHPSSPILNVAV